MGQVKKAENVEVRFYDGYIAPEIEDFAFICCKLEEITLAVDSLNLWVKNTSLENKLNGELLKKYKDKYKR